MQDNSENLHQMSLSRYFGEELKLRMWWRPVLGWPHRVQLGYRSSFHTRSKLPMMELSLVQAKQDLLRIMFY